MVCRSDSSQSDIEVQTAELKTVVCRVNTAEFSASVACRSGSRRFIIEVHRAKAEGEPLSPSLHSAIIELRLYLRPVTQEEGGGGREEEEGGGGGGGGGDETTTTKTRCSRIFVLKSHRTSRPNKMIKV